MELKIEKKEKEPLLSRTKIVARLSFENETPSYKEITPQIAAAAKKEEGLVVIRTVRNYFGDRKAEVTAYAYDDENSKNLTEPKKKSREKKEKAAPAAKKG
ncbi:hypothetical protein HYU10_01645 [Candidatus Woesearchaeota archaeon]|nr:hypothetical protein [Candidatus Woesearchaeota archaeon]MBI2661527.1 hypothetical protein [Candidatus Woesearchaeota archaeon]